MTNVISDKSGYTADERDDFEKFGHPGKWFKIIEVGNGEDLICTGSNFGVGAVIITNTDTTLHLSGGGTLAGTVVGTNTLFEGSIERVQNGSSGVVYALVRNQRIR
jgi:hypothetical protein